MRFDVAIDEYVTDMKLSGRFNSASTERSYRGTLGKHCDDVKNRDPRYTSRKDVKRTLARWDHPNTYNTNRSYLISFYDWMVEEGKRPANPARQTRRAKPREPAVYRLTGDEILRLLDAADGVRERRAIYLGLLAGLRRGEILGLQGRHFQRPGFIWVSPDIGKGKQERWLPVTDDLAPVVDEIRTSLAADDYVLCKQRWRDPGINRVTQEKRKHPMAPKALWELVRRVAVRAGIAESIHPHLLRHAFAGGMARHGGVLATQALLGHKNLATTQAYLGRLAPDELTEAVSGFSFQALAERVFYPHAVDLANPVEAPAGIEPA